MNKSLGGSVYAISFGDRTKVGSSKRPDERVKEITSYLRNYAGMEEKGIFISEKHINYKDNEIKLHDLFSESRINNSEMFLVDIGTVVRTINNQLYLETDFKRKSEEIKKDGEMLVNTFKKVSNSSYLQEWKNIFEDENRLKNYVDMLELHVEQLNVIYDFLYKNGTNEVFERDLYEISNKYKGQQYFINKFLSEEPDHEDN